MIKQTNVKTYRNNMTHTLCCWLTCNMLANVHCVWAHVYGQSSQQLTDHWQQNSTALSTDVYT